MISEPIKARCLSAPLTEASRLRAVRGSVILPVDLCDIRLLLLSTDCSSAVARSSERILLPSANCREKGMARTARTTAAVRVLVLMIVMVRRVFVRVLVVEIEDETARAFGATAVANCNGAERASSVPSAEAITVVDSATPRALNIAANFCRARLTRILHAASLFPVELAISANFFFSKKREIRMSRSFGLSWSSDSSRAGRATSHEFSSGDGIVEVDSISFSEARAAIFLFRRYSVRMALALSSLVV